MIAEGLALFRCFGGSGFIGDDDVPQHNRRPGRRFTTGRDSLVRRKGWERQDVGRPVPVPVVPVEAHNESVVGKDDAGFDIGQAGLKGPKGGQGRVPGQGLGLGQCFFPQPAGHGNVDFRAQAAGHGSGFSHRRPLSPWFRRLLSFRSAPLTFAGFRPCRRHGRCG